MASPTVVTTATSADSSAGTSHTVNLPSGVVSGNLLVITFAINDNLDVITWPAGYTEIFEGGGNVTLAVAYRQADGGEGATITVTSDSSSKAVAFARRITEHEDPSTQAPEASSGATGSSVNPDSDSITPTGGSKDYLFFTDHGHLQTATNDTTPTNYSNTIEAETTSGGRIGGAGAERQLTATSEDPGAWTISLSKTWAAITIAIHPTSGVVTSFPPWKSPINYLLAR